MEQEVRLSGEEEMPGEIMPVPYLPTLATYRRWMQLRLEGCGDAEAWRRMLASTPRAERRRMARATVAGAHGQQPLTLSVPITGGASMLKRGNPEAWRISMHGRWPAVHLGALSAAYSSTAFYQHLMPGIRQQIEGAEEGIPFGSLTSGIHRIVSEWLRIDALLPHLRQLIDDDPERLLRISDEKSIGCHTDLSILDVIFRKGPDSIFTLLTGK